jgi:DNA-binding response OmpR family regulator
MKVLVVEDDPGFVEALKLAFSIRWPEAEVDSAPDGASAIRRFREFAPDIVILDINLPDTTGFEVCQTIRASSAVPIVMVTGRDGLMDVVKGLELGADDYIIKPFDHMEMLARIKAVLRRAGVRPLGGGEAPFALGPFVMDFQAHSVRFHDRPVSLTPLEYNLLFHLVKNHPNVVPHKTLLAKVWGRDYADQLEYLKVHVGRIRAKFAAVEKEPEVIANERGIGYRLALGRTGPAGD